MSAQTDPQSIFNLIQTGRSKAAIKAAKAAMKARPSLAILPNLLGIAQSQSGDLRGSIQSFQKALKLDPGLDDARKNLAQSLMQLGQDEKASKILAELAGRRPKDAGLHYQVAQVALKTGDLAGARQAADAALDIEPRLAPALNLRAMVLERLAGPAAALPDYDAALAINPADVNALMNSATALSRLGRHSEGLARAEAAVAAQPDHPGALLRLATMALETGDTSRARSLLSQFLDREPENANALGLLARVTPKQDHNRIAPQLAKAARRKGLSTQDAATLAFAQAEIARSAGDWSDEATWLAKANRLMAQVFPYDPARDSAEHATLRARSATLGAAAETEAGTLPRPIFVLGLPRSGTSLTETLLSNHDQVHGLGELATTGLLLRDTLKDDAPFEPLAFATAYRAALPQMSAGTRAFVDKMPDNYKYLGFLRAAFPDARFVVLLRDPRATALSIWRTQFTASALSYSFDLSAIAHHANLYQDLMNVWHGIDIQVIFPLHYEALVADPITQTQALAAFCGLDWQPNMARPDLSTAPVTTASVTQVREKLHQRSVAQWRHQQDMLATFVEGLDPALWPLAD